MNLVKLATSEHLDRARTVLRRARRAWSPPPRMSVTEWADTYRQMSAENCAEPGRFNSARAPYQRGPMNAISDPLIETVTIMSSAQVGKNEICHNGLGWIIDLYPGPALWVAPTEKAAEKWSKTRLAPMLRDTPRLKGKVADPKSRDTGNTILEKQFPEGLLFIVGSNAPSGLASQPIQYVFGDEIDRMEASAGTEGDILDLAKKRTTTYVGRRKHVWVSTPGIKGVSRIFKSWEQSDQRRYFMPCPHCGERITFRWKDPDGTYRVIWPHEPEEPEKAYYVCDRCGGVITDAHKHKMLEAGEWIAGRPEVKGHAGFNLNELYSPWRTFGDVAKAFLEAKAGGPMSLMVWVNTSLGEPWDPRDGEGLQVQGLKARREHYAAEVPIGVAYLTLGGDMQDDRWEYIVRGWGHGGESWLIKRGMVLGNPAMETFWADVDQVLSGEFRHVSGYPMRITSACLDSGGHYSKQVKAFCSPRSNRRIFAIQGASTALQKPVMRSNKKTKLWRLDTIALKDTFFACLRVQGPGPGFVHWPDNLLDDYFDQITAEKVVYQTRNGATRRSYKKVTEDARNEALDCEVYAMAAWEIISVGTDDIERVLKALAEQVGRPQGSGPAALPSGNTGHRTRRVRSAGIT
ncbi:phage terminase large subunit family protein [Geothrix sp. 21YS21S-2]|uniref:phage terminase large subunit family protein n=1 Tax=Geothrix sp. 21YS21S-2 TaxID=3068893 RepID=UPI0027B8FE0A|nr:phage terminase large subunit family protein [Geothrix sp. 21YS21S-2]